MQTTRSEFFIKRDFGFYDSGILGCLPDVTFNVYELLRRFVWRSLETGDPDSRRLYADNKLATRMAQSEIANALDRDRKTINGHIGLMKELGWLRVIPDPDNHKPAIYVLGERVRDVNGRFHEVFYADAWIKNLWEKLEQVAKQDMGEDGKVTKMDWVRRRQICKEYMASNSEGGEGGGSTGSDGDETEGTSDDDEEGPHVQKTDTPLSTFRDTPCPENRTPPRGEVSRKVDTEREEKSSLRDDSEKNMNEVRGSASRTSARSHWDKPSRTHPPAAQESKKTPAAVPSAEGDEPLPVAQRLETLHEVANGKPAKYDPRGEGHADKADRAHQSIREREERRRQRLNSKTEGEQAIKEAKRYLRQVWEQETSIAFGKNYPSFGPPEYKQLEGLLENYTQAQLALTIAYTVQQWTTIRQRFLKNEADKLTLSFIWRFHATLVAEGDDYQKIQGVHQEWQEWFKKNPSRMPPRELTDRHRAIEPQLKALGLA